MRIPAESDFTGMPFWCIVILFIDCVPGLEGHLSSAPQMELRIGDLLQVQIPSHGGRVGPESLHV